MYNKFEASINSKIIDAKETICRAMDFLEKNCVNLLSEDKFYLKLMLSELLFNAVRHGNKMDAQKYVDITITVSDDGIRATITDEGSGFDFSSFTSRLKNRGSDPAAEGGRGIQLVYSLADEMTFNEIGNEIGFFKRVDTDG